ncbi:MAG: hypothetical protein IJY50_03020 [Clostridia bacterium]|nr:hypothetical protein [Clostridia bacterium]
MSRMLTDIVGMRCSIKNDEEEYLTGNPEITCRVMAADEEWIRIAYVDERGNRISRLERVDTINSVTVFEDRQLH